MEGSHERWRRFGRTRPRGWRRLSGRSKALIRYRGEYLIDRVVRILRESDCSPIIAVLGFESDRVVQTAALDDVTVVVNFRVGNGYGMFSSGWRRSDRPGRSITIVSVVDQPDVSAQSIARLRMSKAFVVSACEALQP